jgi:hypothetical protein
VLVLRCCALDFTHANGFQSVLHDDAKSWADAGPLKVKYLVNAVNFKHILQSNSQSLKQELLNEVWQHRG